MDPFFEDADRLGKEIAFYTTKQENRRVRYSLISDDLKWGRAYLHAEMLFCATPGRYYSIEDDTLAALAREYTAETGKPINTDELIAEGWLRRVYRLIMLPETTHTLVFYARKIAGVLDTYRFLLEVKDEQNGNSLTYDQLKDLAKDYEQRHDVKLDLEQARKDIFWQEMDGRITYGNLEPYQPVYERLDLFLFLGALYDIFYTKEHDNKLYIGKEMLNGIVDRHRQAFPQTSDLQQMIDAKFITETESIYVLHLENRDTFPVDRVRDRVAAILWLKIRESDRFSTDAHRLRYWYLRVIHRSHWCDITDLLAEEDLRVFLEAAAEAILEDPDLTAGEEEFNKIKHDQRDKHLSLFNNKSRRRWIEPFPVHTDLFILYKELLKLDHNSQGELFILQPARAPLSYFIRQIVANEPDPHSSQPLYPMIMSLLLGSATRPYLLWKVCSEIVRDRPAIIPFLALHEQTASLGFSLLWQAKLIAILPDKGRPVKLTLITDFLELVMGKLALHMIEPAHPSPRRRADIIFQCLLIPTLNKFYTPYGGSVADQRPEKEYVRRAVVVLREVIESAHLNYGVYSRQKINTPLFYPLILPDLFTSIKEYVEPDYFHNQMLSLPFYRLDMLTWLLHIAAEVPTSDPALLFNITSALIVIYLDSINQTEVEVPDFYTDEPAKKVPHWSMYNEGIELIDWTYCCIALSQENLFESFLSPKSFVFVATSNSYHEFNRFTADKLRTHLAILILAYNGLYDNMTELQVEGKDVTGMLCVLEYKITSIVSWYCLQDGNKGRVDIFDSLFESISFNPSQKALLPTISYTINKFSEENKRKIIRELLKNDQLIRSLKLVESLVTEHDKQDLLNSLSTDLISKEIGKMNWYDEQYVLLQLAEHEQFRGKIREVVTEYQQTIENKKGLWQETSLFSFRIKLLLAYQDGDANEIDTIDAPAIDSFNGEHINQLSERDFYRALLFLQKDEPAKAYDLFQFWIDRSEAEKPTWALNRFASKNRLAKDTNNLTEKKRLYFEAIKEWRKFEKSLPQTNSLEYIRGNVRYNKLEALNGAQLDQKFDNEFLDLEKFLQLRPEFLTLRVQNYVKRNMHVQALTLLNEAERYHQLSNGNSADFITKLRETAYTEKSEGYLRTHYDMIFSSPPETLVRIVHRNINKFDTLPQFILQELCSSAMDMLRYINSIAEIALEDKYSDLLTLSLRARLINYNWCVGPARGGFSASEKLNPGEIDFAINTTRAEPVTICEALILRGKDTTVQQSHDFKIFNYDPYRKFLYMIVYYLGDHVKFQRDWEAYRTNCTSVLKFPVGFEIGPKGWEDLPEFSTATLKVGKTMHAGGATLFHLFVNINYLLPKNATSPPAD